MTELLAPDAVTARIVAIPVKLLPSPWNEPENEPENEAADTEVNPVIVDASVSESEDSTARFVPARSVNKFPYVICLLPLVAFPASSFIKNLVLVELVISVSAVDGKIEVAVTPVRFVPSPLNEPVNEPVKYVPAWVVVIT